MKSEQLVRGDIIPAATPIQAISPALKSWIEKCIVPILVREYLATHQVHLVNEHGEVLESDATFATVAKVGQ